MRVKIRLYFNNIFLALLIMQRIFLFGLQGVLLLLLTACGQSGALIKANDVERDKRAKYLLYKHPKAPSVNAEHSDSSTSTTELGQQP